MSLGDIIAAVEADPTHLRICSPGDVAALRDWFGSRNVRIEHTRLPTGGEGFVIVRKGGEFVGSVSLRALRTLSHHRDDSPGLGASDAEFRTLLDLLENTVFTSFDRRQMIATSREIEDRAWRLGTGRLYTGFQSFSVMEKQLDVYRQLATKEGLDIHVFGEPDWTPPEIEGVTRHPSDAPEIARVWFVVFDAEDSMDACALLAEEREPGEFHGFWTYEPSQVAEIVAEIRAVVGE